MSEEIKKDESIETTSAPEAETVEKAAVPEVEPEAPVAAAASASTEAPVAAAAAPASTETRQHPAARVPRFKRKGCKFCQNKNLVIDYKNVEVLERFITERGKILPRRITGTCSKHQRGVSLAIKHARIIAVLPFIVQ